MFVQAKELQAKAELEKAKKEIARLRASHHDDAEFDQSMRSEELGSLLRSFRGSSSGSASVPNRQPKAARRPRSATAKTRPYNCHDCRSQGLPSAGHGTGSTNCPIRKSTTVQTVSDTESELTAATAAMGALHVDDDGSRATSAPRRLPSEAPSEELLEWNDYDGEF